MIGHNKLAAGDTSGLHVGLKIGPSNESDLFTIALHALAMIGSRRSGQLCAANQLQAAYLIIGFVNYTTLPIITSLPSRLATNIRFDLDVSAQQLAD